MIRMLVALLSIFTAPNAHAGEGSVERFQTMREQMVSRQIEARGVKDPRVLEAMRTTPRHWFVPESLHDEAYSDRPLPIGQRQTISQPFIVAIMTELLETRPEDRVLEIGTGSGYQAAVLSKLVAHVYSIEIIPELADSARQSFAEHGFQNISVVTGDGYRGLPDEAPFDGIIVTAAPSEIPPPLIEQLKVGGRMVIPVGTWRQGLKVVTKTAEGPEARDVLAVRFVPMTGEAQQVKPD